MARVRVHTLPDTEELGFRRQRCNATASFANLRNSVYKVYGPTDLCADNDHVGLDGDASYILETGVRNLTRYTTQGSYIISVASFGHEHKLSTSYTLGQLMFNTKAPLVCVLVLYTACAACTPALLPLLYMPGTRTRLLIQPRGSFSRDWFKIRQVSRGEL